MSEPNKNYTPMYYYPFGLYTQNNISLQNKTYLKTVKNKNVLKKKSNKFLKRVDAYNNELKCLNNLHSNFTCICNKKTGKHFPQVLSANPKKFQLLLSNCGYNLSTYKLLRESNFAKFQPITNLEEQVDCIIYNLKKCNIKHLDILSRNICINERGIISLIDFDIASIPEETKAKRIKHRIRKHSYSYLKDSIMKCVKKYI